MQPDAGEFNQRRDLVVGYMPQMFELDEKATVHANILAGAQRVLDLIAEYETRAGGKRAQRDSARSDRAFRRLESRASDQESDHEPARAGSGARWSQHLSGGEKRRVALCRALLARPDFLILDEPTNHLDTGSIEWLEDFLARYQRHLPVRDARSLFSRSRSRRGWSSFRAENSTATTGTTPITCWRAPSVRRSRKCRSTSARNS